MDPRKDLSVVLVFVICCLWLALGSPIINGEPGVRCSRNETVSRCQLCDRDCTSLHIFDPWSTKNRPCPETCSDGAPVCVCKAGFFRHPSGECVLEQECPPACPWANEIANHCDQPFEPRCQPTCSNPTIHPNGTIVILDEDVQVPQFYCRYGVCHTLVCVCRAGFVRHDDTLRCIPQDQCPTLSPAPTEEKDSS